MLKTDARRQLLDAIASLATHKPFFSSQISEALLDSFIKRQHPESSFGLTPRETQIVQLIAEGHTNREIAAILNISLKTVESHRAAVMDKLDLSSSAALVRYAIRNKLVDGINSYILYPIWCMSGFTLMPKQCLRF